MEFKNNNKQIGIICLMRLVLYCWCVFFAITLSSFADDTNKIYSNEFELPSLIECVRFSEPLFFCGNQVPLYRQDVRERLEKEVLLALWDRPQVILWIKRASKYFPHMEKIINQADLPDDLKYVAVIESGLRPHVSSHKGAVGYWQFMRPTGKMYGLKINYKIDERRNLFKSTRSACKYLKELNRQFDDWFLSVAAYNMGARGLKNQIKVQETDEFYSLYLSEETQRYVFKIIAAKFIMENPQKFGFIFQKQDYYPVFEFDKININSSRQLPIALVAKAAGVSFRTIKALAITGRNPKETKRAIEYCQRITKKNKAQKTKIMVIGIPNTGKSTIINSIVGKKAAKTGNVPAITRHNQRMATKDIDIYDTPGILWPVLEPKLRADILAASGAIASTAMDYNDTGAFTLNFLINNYPDLLKTRYKFDKISSDRTRIIEEIGKKRGCLKKGGKIDIQRAYEMLINELRQGKLGRISFEKPENIEENL